MKHRLSINQIYHYASQEALVSEIAVPYNAGIEEQSFSHKLVLELYSKRKMRGDYTAVLGWNFEADNDLKLSDSIFNSNSDIYLPPIGINQRHSVMRHIMKTSKSAFKTLNSLLKHLDLSSVLKPGLGIYQNNIIAKTDIYRDYVKTYLRPAYKYLYEHCESETDMSIILDSMWSMYLEVNKRNLLITTLKKNATRRKQLFIVVDLFDKLSFNETLFNMFESTIAVLKLHNGAFTFNASSDINIKLDLHKYNAIYASIEDTNYARLLINQTLYQDLFLNNYSNTEYDTIVYSNSVSLFDHNIDHIIHYDKDAPPKQAIHIKETGDNIQLYSNSNIMRMFFMLEEEYKKVYRTENLLDNIVRIFSKKGIRIMYSIE